MKKKLLFIYNSHAGKGYITKYLDELHDIFSQRGFDPFFYPTTGPKDATMKVLNDHQNYDRIVCCGGDGTLKEICEGYVKAKCEIPLGYIPAGSTNDFGSSLGLSKDIIEAANVAAGNSIKSIDMGNFNDAFFVYVAAFGLFTDISYETDQTLKNFLGHAAYLLAAGKSVLEIPSFKMRIEADGNVIEDQFVYGMISNSTNVAGMGFLVRGDVDLSDGKFEGLFVRYPDSPIELADALTYLTRIRNKSNLVHVFQANSFKITCKDETPWTLDGEFGGKSKDVLIKNNQRVVNLVTGI